MAVDNRDPHPLVRFLDEGTDENADQNDLDTWWAFISKNGQLPRRY